MSGFALSGLFVTMVSTMRLSVTVITAMRLMQDFHFFKFMTLARNECE